MNNQQQYDEINLMDLFLVALKYKWLIIPVLIIVALSSALYAFTRPNIYTATARLLPPPQSSSGPYASISQSGPGFLNTFLGGQPAPDLYSGILAGREVADALIDKFDLKAVYGSPYMETTRRRLAKATTVDRSKDQIISVSVNDQDAERAAEMANAYVEELDHVYRSLNVTAGHLKRVFLEERVEEVKRELAEAETGLKEFQEKYRLVALNDQARVSIDAAARIKNEITTARTELEVRKKFATHKTNQVVSLNSRIRELENQLLEIEEGELIPLGAEKISGKNSNFYIPFNEFPELGRRLSVLQRRVQLQGELYQMLTTQYELAKIEEAKDFNMVQVLEHAVIPDRKSGPNRKFIIFLSTLGGGFLAILLSFSLEYLQKLKINDEDRYRQLTRHIRFSSPG